MRKRRRLAMLLVMMLMMSMALVHVKTEEADAYVFEVCYECNETGEYHCPVCHNEGLVVCDGCGGTGGGVCPGFEGHVCDGGYYTCTSCGGDGLMRTGDGKIDPEGACGNCGGSGKLRCIVCHDTPGRVICTRCNGAGKTECHVGNCEIARTIGWKCPRCKGTGYTGIHFDWKPEWNDGVRNTPKPGDKIWVDGREVPYAEYFGISEPGGDQGNQGGQGNQEPGGEPGGQGNQEPGGDPGNPGDVPGDIPRDMDIRGDIPAVSQGEAGAVSMEFVYDGLNNEQKEALAAMPEEELRTLVEETQAIVASAEPGGTEDGVGELLSRVMVSNGYESLEDGRIFPIAFTGHKELPFPVEVTVQLRKGELPGGTELYIYHVLSDGSLEPLGKAMYTTYDDGSVETIRFRTMGFSSFFTVKGEVRLNPDNLPEVPQEPAENPEDNTDGDQKQGDPGTDNPGAAVEEPENAPAQQENGKDGDKSSIIRLLIGFAAVAILAVGGFFVIRKK